MNTLNRRIHYLTFSLLIIFSTSCAFVPVRKPLLATKDDCQMLTRELALESIKITQDGSCSGNSCAIFIVIPASTFLVSGSIVAIGNTLHWLERNGTCDDGLIKQNLDSFFEWAFNSGAEKVKQ